MAFVENREARIYWNEVGKGEPLVLIMGLGCSSAMWFRLVPLLAKHHRVILLDNRGVGQTDVQHFVVHRVTNMASDVAAVMDAAGVDCAHVVGLSMGGMIAQEFALDYPERVRSLSLMATNCGGSRAVLADPKVWRLLFSKGEASPQQALELMRPYTYAAKTPDHIIEEDHAVRLANYPTLRGYQAQLYGLMGWSSYGRLPQLACPTQIIHGTEDLLIPLANARVLAKRIVDSELLEIEGASHWLHSDRTEQCAKLLRNFSKKHSGAAASRT